MSDILLLLSPVALLAVVLLVLRLTTRRARPRRGRRAQPLRPIVIDGSNVLYWKDNTPRIDTLREVVTTLKASGYDPGVVFDANAGYLLTGRYQHDGALGRLLSLPEKNVMVVPKGTPADPMILAAARDLGAPVLTNDRYRDWAAAHPEIATPGHLIRGRYTGDTLVLDLPPS